MHILTVDASRAQGRKLAKGMAVRIKKGTGFNLIVHPTTYRLATRAFNKGKAVQIKLSPEELEQNKAVHGKPEMMEDHEELDGEMVGQGFFDFITKPISKAYRSVKKGISGVVGKVGKFVQQPSVLRALKTAGKFAASKLADAGAAAVSTLPGGMLLSRGVKNLGVVANKAIDDPSSVGGLQGAAKTLITGKGTRRCGSATGYGFNSYGSLHDAAKASASANAGNAHFIKQGIHSIRGNNQHFHDSPFSPRSRGMGIVGRGGGVIGMHEHGYYPPALISQPYSANYQMSHFLPTQYQHYNHSMTGYDDSSSDEEMEGRGMHRHRHRGRGFGLYV